MIGDIHKVYPLIEISEDRNPLFFIQKERIEMKLLKLFISITQNGGIAYSETQSLSGEGVLGTTRLVTFNKNQQRGTQSNWLFTDYTKEDYQTLVEDGYDVMYVDTSSGNHYTQEQVNQMNTSDYSVISSSTTSNDSVDSFTS